MPVNKPVIVLAGQLGAGCTETAEKLAKNSESLLLTVN